MSADPVFKAQESSDPAGLDHILVVDDDPQIRDLLAALLTFLGASVQTAQDGEEAWCKFQDRRPSMVLTDWNMPNMSGLDLMQRIRSVEGGESVYIILLTGNSAGEDMVKAMQAGADDYLSKPCDMAELRVRIQAGQRLVHMQQHLREQNERYEQDLAAASQLQRALLPQNVPQPRGYTFAWEFDPCATVSGDMLNVFGLDENRVGFFVLDVSGHGAAAAMLAVTAGRMLIPVAGQDTLVKHRIPEPPYYAVPDPVDVMRALRERFTETERTGLFFTMLYGVLNIAEGRVLWTSAGHEPPIVTSGEAGRVIEGEETGTIIGPDLPTLDPERSNELILKPGERLWLYTDGIVEARTPDGSFYTGTRLEKSLQGLCDVPLAQAVGHVITEAGQWTGVGFQDDVSVLALEHLAEE